MNWSPSMIKRRDVFAKLSKEYPGDILYRITDKEVHLLRLKNSPENIELIFFAAKKYHNLVVL